MPTLEQLEKALRNADAAGDVEAARSLAQAIQQKRIEPPAPTNDPGLRGSRLDGVLTGIRDPIDGLAQLAPRGLSALTSLGGNAPNRVSEFFDNEARKVDQVVKGNEREYQDARQAQGREGFDWARLGGNVASPANVAAGAVAGRVAGAIPRIGRTGQAVATGAAFGGSQPVFTDEYGKDKLTQTAIGAALGPVGNLVGRGTQGLIKPQVDDAQRLLLREGVELTPGQVSGGAMKLAEDKAVSIPFTGDAIRSAQQRGIESLNRAALNRALAPIGQKLPDGKVGHEGLAYVRKTLGDEYERILPQLQFKPDAGFSQELGKVMQMVSSPAFTKKTQFDAILRDKLISKMTPQGNMSGESFKLAEEGLKKEAKRFLSSPDPDQRMLGEALTETLEISRRTLMRGNPQKASELSKLNKAWANYAIVRKAASAPSSVEGIFSPAQLQQAVRASDKGVKTRFSEGRALMQDLSDAGKAVLPSNVPNSGTADRLYAGAALGSGFISPYPLMGMAGGAGLYSRPAQSMYRGLLNTRLGASDELAQFGRETGQHVGILGLLPAFPAGQ